MTPMVTSPVIRKRFTADEYAPMAAAGVLTENDVMEAGRAPGDSPGRLGRRANPWLSQFTMDRITSA